MENYRIVLQAEDGEYVLEIGIPNYQLALSIAEKLAENYGEGQNVIIESYCTLH